MKAIPLKINWHSGLPIFAKESFLKEVSDDYGWIGGIDNTGKLKCVLPYTIIKKSFIRLVRFRVETIPLDEYFELKEEREFLNSAVKYLRSIGADVIIPATTNSIFRTYPDGADAAPYGSYVIDLRQTKEILWGNIDRRFRQDINKAMKSGILVSTSLERIRESYDLICDTFKRSHLPFMSYKAFASYMKGLGENGKLMIAEYEGVIQSCVVFAYSEYCAYAVYAGNITNQQQGSNKLIYWEAIWLFHELGVKFYDFVGARINPEQGSKQESLNRMKRYYGTELKQGYIWKYNLRPFKSYAYSVAVRMLRGGDLVDAERHKMHNIPD